MEEGLVAATSLSDKWAGPEGGVGNLEEVSGLASTLLD